MGPSHVPPRGVKTPVHFLPYARCVKRAESLLRVLAAYVVAFAAFGVWLAWGPRTGHLWLDGLDADLIATLVVFVASRLHHNSSFYDPYWSVLPPLLLVGWWLRVGTPAGDARGWLVAAVVLVWSVRLTANWTLGFPGLHHEDWRYPMLRERAGRWELPVDLFAIHVIPTLQVFVGMIPAYLVLTAPRRALGWLDVLALLVGLGAVLLELVADTQMHRFAATKQPGAALERGVWAWSRHPNYFGEFSFWLALGLFGLAADPHQWWWVFAGALVMLALFELASIPMMERRSLERRPSYSDVIERVPRFVPRPPLRLRGPT